MNILVFDTETTALDKPFCYDIGYVIYDTDEEEIVLTRHFIVEQVWHNLPLFESAYYKEKRPIYISLMRSKKATMSKWGYIMRVLARDIKLHEISDAYAFNSSFDDKVFAFNCDWYKCNNPLECVAIHDIWGYSSQFITNTKEYREYCEEHQFFNDSGNYKGSAEAVYRFISRKDDFDEAHMGLYDSIIECEILIECIKRGGELSHDYKVNKVLSRVQEKPFTIKINNKVLYTGQYIKKYVRDDKYYFTIRD